MYCYFKLPLSPHDIVVTCSCPITSSASKHSEVNCSQKAQKETHGGLGRAALLKRQQAVIARARILGSRVEWTAQGDGVELSG